MIGSKSILPPNISSVHRRTRSSGSDGVAPAEPPYHRLLGLHAETERFDSSKPPSIKATSKKKKKKVNLYLKELRVVTLNVELI